MAVNLSKEKDNTANMEMLVSIMQPTSYTFKEMLELIKNNNLDEKTTEKSLLILSEIIDDTMNGTVEIENSSIVFYGSKFMLREVYENQKNNISQNINNIQSNSVSNISQNVNNNQSNSNNVSVSNNSSSLNKLTQKSKLESMEIEDLLEYVFLSELLNKFYNQIFIKLDTDQIKEILEECNISHDKVHDCINFLLNIVDMSIYEKNIPVDYYCYKADTNFTIIKHITNKKIYYYIIDETDFVFYNCNYSIQKYFLNINKSDTLDALQFNVNEDLLINDKLIDNIGLLILAMKYKDNNLYLISNNVGKNIWCSLSNVICDYHRIQSCMFDMKDFLTNKQVLVNAGYIIHITNKQDNLKYYGGRILHESRAKYINNVVKEFLYDNMVVLTEYKNNQGEIVYQAIPSRYISVIYDKYANERYFCTLDTKQKLSDVLKHNRKFDINPNRAIYNIANGEALLFTNNLSFASCYEAISLNELCREVIDTSKNAVTLNYLKQIIGIPQILEYIDKKDKNAKQKVKKKIK